MRFPDLGPVLDPIQWAAVGAAAARMYMAERATDDLDVLIRAGDRDEVRARLAQAGWKYRGELTVGGSSWVSPSGFPLDVLEGLDEWCGEAIAAAQKNRDAHGMPVVPLQFLTLMKFEASRAIDIGDLTRLLGQATPEQLEEIRAAFQRWQPDGLADIESLITLGRMELERPGERKRDEGAQS